MSAKRAMVLASLVAISTAIAGCGQQPEPGAGGERKSPFATGNVSTAPQIEGRAQAPTPVPAPRPQAEPDESDQE